MRETCVFKTWGDLSWGIIVLMSLLTQDFCQKSSRSFSFHREWKIKKKKPPHFQPLRFALSVCSGELKTDAKTDLVPKLLKKAEAPSAEMGHWPKPLDSWNKVERVLKDPCKFQSCLSRNWKQMMFSRGKTVFWHPKEFLLWSKWLTFKPNLASYKLYEACLNYSVSLSLRFNIGRVADLLRLWTRTKWMHL